MEIIEYDKKYEEDAKDLLVELEEYIVSIDQDELDQVGEEYREKMLGVDFKELEENEGKCFLAVEDGKAIGLIMGCLRAYEEADHLDYKCPKSGAITELIVTNKIRSSGVGKALMQKMEEYLKSLGCEYILIDLFAYNKNAENFYTKGGYHARMHTLIKKVGEEE
ncbi:MAG: GNAT family N-acetyltransferase [Bacilli bacterium]|nr:GNAT family N-acetyltransferase [Bacilli bacterium]